MEPLIGKGTRPTTYLDEALKDVLRRWEQEVSIT